MELTTFAGMKEMTARTTGLITSLAAERIRQNDVFHFVLSGGRSPRILYESLRYIKTDWRKWHFWLGDERITKCEEDLNSRLAQETWLAHVPVDPSKVHFADTAAGVENAASLYNRALAGIPDFDLVLLGMGEDGHTASLFPGYDWGRDKHSPDVIAVTHSPKPPPERISLTVQRINRSSHVLFFTQGEEKKTVISRILAGEPLPCNAVKGKESTSIYHCH